MREEEQFDSGFGGFLRMWEKGNSGLQGGEVGERRGKEDIDDGEGCGWKKAVK